MLEDSQKLIDSAEFFDLIQRNFKESVEIGEEFESRIATIMAALGDSADKQGPLLELAIWMGTYIKEVMRTNGDDLRDPEVCTEWKINFQVAIVMAGAMHVIACLGTRKNLQAVDALMKLETQFADMVLEEGKKDA